MNALASATRSIEGIVTFAVDTGVKPVTYPERQTDTGSVVVGQYEDRPIKIHDARAIRNQLSLDAQGFTLIDEPTAMRDYFDDAEVRATCYAEVDATVKRYTGVKKVVIFDHTIRVEHLEKRKLLKARAPVLSVHNDYTDWSAPKRVQDLLPEAEAAERLARRFIFINVWRPIRGPIQTAPLVLCDARTMTSRDLIAADHIYDSGRRGETYRVAHSPTQHWYYFSDMRPGEAVLIKCFDSAADGRAKFSGHGAARLTSPAPAGAVPRESIEIRTIGFY